MPSTSKTFQKAFATLTTSQTPIKIETFIEYDGCCAEYAIMEKHVFAKLIELDSKYERNLNCVTIGPVQRSFRHSSNTVLDTMTFEISLPKSFDYMTQRRCGFAPPIPRISFPGSIHFDITSFWNSPVKDFYQDNTESYAEAHERIYRESVDVTGGNGTSNDQAIILGKSFDTSQWYWDMFDLLRGYYRYRDIGFTWTKRECVNHSERVYWLFHIHSCYERVPDQIWYF